MVAYIRARIGVDAVVFTISRSELQVILHCREKPPFKGRYELPGGLLREEETVEDALQRKLQEVVGKKTIFFEQFHTFTAPDRDPRERTISVGFIALINHDEMPYSAAWFSTEKLPDLAFDHGKIIEKAKQYLKDHANHLVVKQFMPAKFPLNDLQRVYETIEDVRYDNRNFRKKMLQSGIVRETKEFETNVSHRPAKLYRFAK